MKKATYIKPEDLQNLEYDENGNIIIPEGFEIYIKKSPDELRQQRINELQEQLNNMKEPTEQELIEEGKMMHPFYIISREINDLIQCQ